jgi:hypothetical protein
MCVSTRFGAGLASSKESSRVSSILFKATPSFCSRMDFSSNACDLPKVRSSEVSGLSLSPSDVRPRQLNVFYPVNAW